MIPLSHMLKEIGTHHGGVAVLPSPLVYLAELAKYWKKQNNDNLASRFADAMMVENPAFDLPGSWLHNCLHDLIIRYREDRPALTALLKICGKNLPTTLTMDNTFEKYVGEITELEDHLRWRVQAICRNEREMGSMRGLRASQAHMSSQESPYDPYVWPQAVGPPFQSDIFEAIKMGDIGAVCILLSQGINPNIKVKYSNLALQEA